MTDATIWDEFTTDRIEPERDRFGRYLVPDGSGKKVAFTRATTIASTLADKYALNLWSQRMTALGLAKRHDLYLSVASTDADDKDTLNRLVEEAKEAAAASAGRNMGSALHGATEQLDRGKRVVLPPPWDTDLVTYRQTLDLAGISVHGDHIEQVVLLPEFRVAGTFDRIVTQRGVDLPRVFDLKTGGFLPWDEIAIQLALYAHAESIYDPATGTTTPMPDVDRDTALVCQLRPGEGSCRLFNVDIAAGWEAAKIALWVRKWRNNKRLSSEFKPDADDAGLRAEHARTRLVALVELQATVAWPVNVPTFRQARDTGHVHTAQQLDLIEAAIAQAETAADAPFGSAAPTASEVRCLDMIARLQRLPADLLQSAESVAKREGIPNLRTGRATVRDLDWLDEFVTELEAGIGTDLTSADSALEEGAQPA